MTEPGPAALTTALAYYRAWTGGDFDQAMTHVADDIVCLTPSGPLTGAVAFRAFMEPFAKILTRSELLPPTVTTARRFSCTTPTPSQ